MSRNLAVTIGSGAQAKERLIEVEPLPPEGGSARVRITLEGRGRILDLFRHPDGVVTLRDPESDRLFTVEVDGTTPTFSLTVGDHTLGAKTESARSRALRGLGRADHGGGGQSSVGAPMPGRVVKLLVERGAAVKAGQGLVIVEAMKMENEVRCPRDGTVAEIRVREGQAVEASETLLVVA